MTSVAFLVDQLSARTPGGIGTYTRELLLALTRADPSLRIAAFRSKGPDLPAWEFDAPEPVELPWAIRRSYPLWALTGRPSLPERLQVCDLLHSPLPAAVPPAGLGQRLVVTVHDAAFLVRPDLFPRQWALLYRAAFRRAARHADAILVPSEHTAADVARLGKVERHRIHVTPLAAATSAPAIDVERTLQRLRVPRPFVLSVGTLEPRKNLPLLVRTYRQLAVRGAPQALVLAGGVGWRSGELLRETRAEAPGRVVLTGAMSGAELDALYRTTDAFVYPSLYEGFGLPVLEAMSRGAPSIVSNAASLPEVAGDAAVLFDPRSQRDLLEAMERVLGDTDLAARLRASGQIRAATFTWHRTARLTLEAYRSVVDDT
ncbi:MAG TPA: glycosyltransferase family 1 protein [Actinobacteria bacterium]|nr:glycosyltransferase family 1 protein [Actinomycetota bacterium]